ncbi:MAG: VOC family protein [Waddliaceae bacterium]
MDLCLHHIGILVKDISQATTTYKMRFGYEIKSDVVHDPFQTAYVQFLKLPNGSDYVEFISPDGPKSKLTNALKKGGGLNHLCYMTDDIDSACEELRATGMYLLQPPVDAVAFKGRRIAWLMGREMIPTELVERGEKNQI